MALKVKYSLKSAQPFYYVSWNPQASKDGTRASAMFGIRHPKEADKPGQSENIAANGFAFWADFNGLRQGWEEGYRQGSTKPPSRKPDPLMLACDGFPEPPDGYETDDRTPKGGWKLIYRLPIVLPDGRRGVFESSKFAGRVAIEKMLAMVNADPVERGDEWAYFRCVGTYAHSTRSGATIIPTFVLERWGMPEGAANPSTPTTTTPAKKRTTKAAPVVEDNTPETPIAAEPDPAATAAPAPNPNEKLASYKAAKAQRDASNGNGGEHGKGGETAKPAKAKRASGSKPNRKSIPEGRSTISNDEIPF